MVLFVILCVPDNDSGSDTRWDMLCLSTTYGICELLPSLQMVVLHGFGLKTPFNVFFTSFQVPISGLGSPTMQLDSQPHQFGLGHRFEVFNHFREGTGSRKTLWRNEWSRNSENSNNGTCILTLELSMTDGGTFKVLNSIP